MADSLSTHTDLDEIRDLPWAQLAARELPAPALPAAKSKLFEQPAMPPLSVKWLRSWRALAIASLVALLIVGGLVYWLWPPAPAQLIGANPAWACADGYVLHFDVRSKYNWRFDEEKKLAPGMQQFIKAARRWARTNSMTCQTWHPEHDKDWRIERLERPFPPTKDLTIILYGPAYHNTLSGKRELVYWAGVTLQTDDSGMRDDLANRLSLLSGVALRETRKATLYFHQGLSEVMLGKKVLMDGVEYRFPEDFNELEAQQLSTFFRNHNQLEYRAFFKLGVSMDRHGQYPEDRFDLGDIVKLTFDQEGNLVFTTVVQHWDVDRSQARVHGGSMGWYVRFPEGMTDAGVDPIELMSRRFTFNPADGFVSTADYRLIYQLFDPAMVYAKDVRKFTPDQVALHAHVLAEAKAVVRDWLEAHPEFKRRPPFMSGVWVMDSTFGELVESITVSIRTDDVKIVREICTLLNGIDGMPKPYARLVGKYSINKNQVDLGDLAQPADPDSVAAPPQAD